MGPTDFNKAAAFDFARGIARNKRNSLIIEIRMMEVMSLLSKSETRDQAARILARMNDVMMDALSADRAYLHVMPTVQA